MGDPTVGIVIINEGEERVRISAEGRSGVVHMFVAKRGTINPVDEIMLAMAKEIEELRGVSTNWWPMSPARDSVSSSSDDAYLNMTGHRGEHSFGLAQDPCLDDGALIRKMRHLVSFDEPDRGGPYGGSAARSFVETMKRAADRLETLLARVERLERKPELPKIQDSVGTCSICGNPTLVRNLRDSFGELIMPGVPEYAVACCMEGCPVMHRPIFLMKGEST